jgi:hypothetical protein
VRQHGIGKPQTLNLPLKLFAAKKFVALASCDSAESPLRVFGSERCSYERIHYALSSLRVVRSHKLLDSLASQIARCEPQERDRLLKELVINPSRVVVLGRFVLRERVWRQPIGFQNPRTPADRWRWA